MSCHVQCWWDAHGFISFPGHSISCPLSDRNARMSIEDSERRSLQPLGSEKLAGLSFFIIEEACLYAAPCPTCILV